MAILQDDTDLLFPDRLIPDLAGLRGARFDELVARVNAAGPDSVERAAFVLLMVRLNGCGSCNADSFRAMQGCLACSQQTLKRFRSTDDELDNLFATACREVEEFRSKKG